MKRNIATLACALFGTIHFVSAQDVIICRNGDEISSKILKISKTEIEYKKWSNQDGPTYTLEKSDVFLIKYQNGEKDVFKDAPVAQSESAGAAEPADEQAPNEPILAKPAANNAELIAQYNNATYEYVLDNPKRKKNKKAVYVVGTLGVTSSSILSTDDIEISFLNVDSYSSILENSVGDVVETRGFRRLKYAIMIKNKTSRIIYIDKAACLGAYSIGMSKKYFDSQELTITEGEDSGSGASVNLGSVADALGVGGVVGTLASGVNVGGDKGKFSAMTRTIKDDRILTIPPQSLVALSEDKTVDHPSKKCIVKGAYEYFSITGLSSLKVDELKEFTEENTPNSINYMITYSFDKELSKCYMVNFGVFLKDAFGVKYSAFDVYSSELGQIRGKIVKTESPKVIMVKGYVR